MFKSNFSERNKNWGAQKKFGEVVPPNAPPWLRACLKMLNPNIPKQSFMLTDLFEAKRWVLSILMVLCSCLTIRLMKSGVFSIFFRSYHLS